MSDKWLPLDYVPRIKVLVDNEATARQTADTQLNSSITALQSSKEAVANKGVAGGYCALDSNGKVPTSCLPVYNGEVV